MSVKWKVALFLFIVFSIIFVVSENKLAMSISFFGVILLVISMKLIDYILRLKLIKKMKRKKIEYIKVKEKNKLGIIPILISIVAVRMPIQSRYEAFKSEYKGDTNMLAYINSFESDEKVILLAAIMVIIFSIISITQILLNPCLVSKDKVIFSDGIVFDIDKIESIEYKSSFSSKNKNLIKVSKGMMDRTIITGAENFDKVKMLLEYKC